MPRQSKPYWDKNRLCWSLRYKNERYRLCGGGPANHAEAWRAAARIVSPEPSSGPLTIVQAIEAWLVANPDDGWHAMILKPFMAWSDPFMLDDVHDQTLADYLKHLDKNKNYAPSVLRRQIRYARTVLVWAHVRGYLHKPVPTLPRLPRIVHVPRDIPLDDLQAIFDKLPKNSKRIFSFLMRTGCRPSEACLLTWDEIHGDRCQLLRGKTFKRTGNMRIIHMSPQAIALLGEDMGHGGFVFLSRLKKPYTSSGLRSIFHRAGRIAGLKKTYNVYNIRHTFAQHAVDSEFSIDDLGLALGHIPGSTETRVYAQIKANRAKQLIQSLSSAICLDLIPEPSAGSDS